MIKWSTAIDCRCFCLCAMHHVMHKDDLSGACLHLAETLKGTGCTVYIEVWLSVLLTLHAMLKLQERQLLCACQHGSLILTHADEHDYDDCAAATATCMQGMCTCCLPGIRLRGCQT